MNYPLLTKKMLRAQQGASLVEVAIILPVVVLLIAGIIDLGRAYYYSNALARASEAGALYGSQDPSDTAGMINASNNDAQSVPGASATAIYGCECSDGSEASGSCSNAPDCTNSTNEVYYVTVTAKATYKPLVPWPGLPSTFNLASTVTMRSGG